ncbi:MAG: DNA mismatch repair endonuclease MutL [Bacteroidaceae bacterium]|nr:DNA mismatch repair endonuclease MutL [Bacteroidaceae bacterium]
MAEDLIHLLPDSVANQIAAGEVIQRPASVVKELVENAVDAGATSIQIRLTDAGRTNIQVIDNGKGMSETDARMSFERHATSKIKAPDDLFALHTFGFRGEALPSIAAVSQVELRTRRAEDELGTIIHIAGSKLEGQEVGMCPMGTNFQVKNLFFNVPARRKFLKSNQTELNNVLAEVERVALVHPEIAFAVYHNEVELINVPQATSRQRIQHLFGKKLGQELLSVEVDTTLAKITGCVGVPESARKKGAHCFFFVNGRYMRHPYFHKAVMEAYAHLIPAGEQVPYFLYFTVDPSRIDVNIHPTKTEIKFEDEQPIWQILMAAVREVLGRSHMAPSIDFDLADCPDIPLFSPDGASVPPPMPTVDSSYNPFKQSSPDSYKRPSVNWESLYKGAERSTLGDKIYFDDIPDVDLPASSPSLFASDAASAPLPSASSVMPSDANGSMLADKCADCYQYKGSYVVTSIKSGLMMVDQHRAHVRILYHRYLTQLNEQRSASQGMLFPEMLTLSMSQAVEMEHLLDDFASLGFDISNMGGGTFAIQGVPAGIEGLAPTALVEHILSDTIEKGDVSREEIHRTMALTMARSAAIVAGQILSVEEMTQLIDELFACDMPAYTPDGKKTFVVIDEDEILKRFR